MRRKMRSPTCPVRGSSLRLRAHVQAEIWTSVELIFTILPWNSGMTSVSSLKHLEAPFASLQSLPQESRWNLGFFRHSSCRNHDLVGCLKDDPPFFPQKKGWLGLKWWWLHDDLIIFYWMFFSTGTMDRCFFQVAKARLFQGKQNQPLWLQIATKNWLLVDSDFFFKPKMT